ncbi:MAG: M48 family metallopeptidase [Betaproteobacteria bacterium]|nr:M48 family metallopeptidase [Betaproteobacteria bacterium]
MKWLGFLKPTSARPSRAAAPSTETTTRSIALNGHPVDYKLVRKRGRRNIALKIDGTGMTVAASLTTPISAIEGLIDKNTPWVIKKLDEWSHRRIVPQAWHTGASLPFMGQTLTLMIDAGAAKNEVELVGTYLFARLKNSAAQAVDIEKAVMAWYKKQALPHLAQRAFFYAKLHGLVPPRVFLSSAQGRWGSCNSRREVRLSWRLMKARPALIDYVVCHELAHLRHMNHSAAFWQEVARMCPDYMQLKRELDNDDHRYRAF